MKQSDSGIPELSQEPQGALHCFLCLLSMFSQLGAEMSGATFLLSQSLWSEGGG